MPALGSYRDALCSKRCAVPRGMWKPADARWDMDLEKFFDRADYNILMVRMCFLTQWKRSKTIRRNRIALEGYWCRGLSPQMNKVTGLAYGRTATRTVSSTNERFSRLNYSCIWSSTRHPSSGRACRLCASRYFIYTVNPRHVPGALCVEGHGIPRRTNV